MWLLECIRSFDVVIGMIRSFDVVVLSTLPHLGEGET